MSALLSTVAFIHLLPAVGALGAGRLQRLYQVPVSDPNLELLLRHRAVLFGLLGGFLLVTALWPALTAAGLGAGLVSVLSFLGLARGASLNEAMRRVVRADRVALVCLLVAAAAHASPRGLIPGR